MVKDFINKKNVKHVLVIDNKSTDKTVEVAKKAGIDEIVKGYKLSKAPKRKVLGMYHKWELLTAHDLRRSFATNYFGKIETPILMHITGHTKESTFLKYIGKTQSRDAYADVFMEKARFIL